MECEYFTPPMVTCDAYNIYVCRGDTVISSDVEEGKLGSTPFEIVLFIRRDNHYYFLDGQNRLWYDGQLIAEGIRDLNDHHILGCNGYVWTLQGANVPLLFSATRLVGDLLIDEAGVLYDTRGQYITSQVSEAHTDGNEIIVIHQGPGRILEYIGDNSNKQLTLGKILRIQGARKAVISQGSLLLLLPDGSLIAAGANRNCECGTDETPVLEPRKLELPFPVIDFGFNRRVGWALLSNHSVYVWGFNDSDCLFFLQWPNENFISPRLLPL